MTSHPPSLNDLTDYAVSVPVIYKSIFLAFRDAFPERKYCEPVLESALRNYMKYPKPATALAFMSVSATDVELTEALRQLIAQGFVSRLPLSSQHDLRNQREPGSVNFDYDSFGPYLLALSPLGESLLEAITGRRTPDPIVPKLPIPSWAVLA